MSDIRKFINLVESILNEALPLSLAKKYSSLTPDYNKEEYDAIFEKFRKYGRGKQNLQRLYFPLNPKDDTGLPNTNSIKSRIFSAFYQFRTYYFISERYTDEANSLLANTQIVATSKKLADFDMNKSSALYKKGLIQCGNRQIKIGKIFEDINKCIDIIGNFTENFPPDERRLRNRIENSEFIMRIGEEKEKFAALYKLYQNDPERAASKASGYYCVISRHPIDIAGMSTDRGWTSCTDLLKGAQRVYVKAYVVNGNLIAYLIKEGDWNIKSPTSRQLICRYNNTRKRGDYLFWPQESAYGTYSPAFNRFVEVFCKWINRGKDDGVYEAEDDQQYTGQVRKNKNDFRLGNEHNNNRHNPNDPDDEDYDPDADYYDEEYYDDEPEQPDYDYLRELYRQGINNHSIEYLRHTYNLTDTPFEIFTPTPDNTKIIIKNYYNLRTCTSIIDDGVVLSIARLLKNGYEEESKNTLKNVLSDHDLMEVIDRLSTQSYEKLMKNLKIKVVKHNDSNYQRALRLAVKNIKNSDEWNELQEKAMELKLDSKFDKFLKDRLQEYVDYGWRMENEKIKIGLLEGMDGYVSVYLDIKDAFEAVIEEECDSIKEDFNIIDESWMENRAGKMPEAVHAILPKENRTKSFFGDDKEEVNSYPLAAFKADGSFQDDEAVMAYLERSSADTEKLAEFLEEIINKVSLA